MEHGSDSCHGGCHPVNAELQLEPIRVPDGTGRSLAQVLADSPPEAVIELAPGRYQGPVVLTRPVTLRGAGDLTRISAAGRASVVEIRLAGPGIVVLESLLIEDGFAESGAGIHLVSGRARLHNVQVQHCRATRGGGAIHVGAGEMTATLIRAHDVSGAAGGAVRVSGEAVLNLRDSQIFEAEAARGGAVSVEDAARVVLEGLTIGRVRATTPSGGQAVFVRGSAGGAPTVLLRRVRLEDAPFGMPLVVDVEHPGRVSASECDMPRVVAGVPGLVDGGENVWR